MGLAFVRVRFRDSDGAGFGDQVLFEIHQSNINSGGNNVIFTFDSNMSGLPPSSSFQTELLSGPMDFDFANNIYWIETKVTRNNPGDFANIGSIDILESAGTPCP